AESMTCLRARILGYFGESGHLAACGNCGPCLAPPVTLREAATARDSDLFQELRALRRRFAEEADVPPFVIFSDATLREMAASKPRSQAEMLGVTGVGQAKWAKYGEAFLAVTRAAATGPSEPAAPEPQPPRQPTVRSQDGTVVSPSLHRTYLYLREGLTLQQIADRRGFTLSTIAQHIAQLISHGDIVDVSPWVDDLLLARIRRAANGERIGPVGPIREALGDAVTYEQLHIARAFINRP
ncbi:MAG: HRDC domain-containing protein, partial [Dehalococcoidia bacterium]